MTRELVNAGEWVSVATPEEADFILKMESKKKMVFNSPRTWLTPYVLDKIEDYESRPWAFPLPISATCSGSVSALRPANSAADTLYSFTKRTGYFLSPIPVRPS